MDIAERLRFVEPITSRGEHLKRELRSLQGEDPPEAGHNMNGESGTAGVQGLGALARSEETVTSGSSHSTVTKSSSGGRSVKAGGSTASADGQERGDGGSKDGLPAAGVSSLEGHASAGGEEGQATGGTAGVSVTSQARSAPGQRRCRCKGDGRSGGGGRRRTRGFLPVCQATDPICPIVRIPPEEGHVFKTKQRAPTLITCEIIVPQGRQQGVGDQDDHDSQRQETEGDEGGDSDYLAPPSPIATTRAESADGGGTTDALEDGNSSDVAAVSSGSGDSLTMTRTRSDPVQRGMSRQGSGLAKGARGSNRGMPSPLHLHRRKSSRGSDREEVEEIIGTQVRGCCRLGR